MILTTLRRITRTGFVNFWRNSFLSFAAVVVITLSLCAFGALIFGSAFGRALIDDVKDKVDINVYFSTTAPETDILSLKKDVEGLPEVSKVDYVSRDDVLAQFKTKWQDNALIMQGLDEIGDNPFPAMLTIKAKDPGQYGGIANFLQTNNPADASGTPIIVKVNYEENKLIIDRLSKIIPTVQKVGMIFAFLLVIVAVIVVFNTIRLVIYTAREEISVMKLVGASNIYVRGPLVVSGIMYGIVSALITLGLMWVFATWSDQFILRFAGVDIASNFELMVNVLSRYFVSHLPQITFVMFAAGIILGGVSSYVAAKRYLKV